MKLIIFSLLTLSWNVDIFGFDISKHDSASLRIKRTASGEAESKFNATWADRLKKDLLLNYDKYSRPTLNGSKIEVELGCVLRHIELDEENSIMKIHTWLQMTWDDQKLKWNASDYGGIDKLNFADHEVWLPDILPYNGILDDGFDHFSSAEGIAFNNGRVIWVPQKVFKVYCGLDFTYWPFDVQNCALTLGSWTYSESEVDLRIKDSPDMTSSDKLVPNSEWKFLSIEAKKHSTYYSCCPQPYVDITYNIKIQRQSPTYVALLITPATAIIVMALAIFLIPPTSTDKITLGGTTIIITCLFLLYFTQKLPVMTGSTPLIVVFYSRTLYLLSVAIIISVTVINIAKNPKFSPLPWSIKRLLTGCLGKCLLINNLSFKDISKTMQNTGFKADEVGDSLPVLPEQEKHNEGNGYGKFQQDWIMLAVAIDRLTFVIYCLIFIIFAIAYSV